MIKSPVSRLVASSPAQDLPDGFSWDLCVGERNQEEIVAISAAVWPRYLREKSDLQFSHSEGSHSDVGFMFGIRNSKALVAIASAVSLNLPGRLETLPDDGWNFAMKASLEKGNHNAICLLAACVLPKFRGHGLSRMLLKQSKLIANHVGATRVIAPVRPTLKHEVPWISMESYLEQEFKGGKIFDPWLRTHQEEGAKIMNICSQSFVVKATLSQWAEWLDVADFPTHLPFYPKDGLAPLEINWSDQTAVYQEPNVWTVCSI